MADRVPEEHLGPTFEACPLCGFEGERTPEIVLQDAPEVWMRRCPRCHASCADRFPDDAFLAKLYDPSHYSSPLSAQDHISARCAERILAYFDPAPDAELELVDYGGNRGTLVRVLRDALLARGHRGRIRGTVVDLFPAAGDDAVRFITPEQFAAESTRYDLVLASAVLEHLTNMPDVVRQLLAVARDGAIFYARTPYDVPLAKLGVGYPVRWPRHLYDLGPAFWSGFLDVFDAPGDVLVSRPSLVETSLQQSPGRTVAAHVLKFPARLEVRFLGRRVPWWRWVGGWEMVARLSGR